MFGSSVKLNWSAENPETLVVEVLQFKVHPSANINLNDHKAHKRVQVSNSIQNFDDNTLQLI